MISTIAATNDGIAAEIDVTTNDDVSNSPGLRPEIRPIAMRSRGSGSA